MSTSTDAANDFLRVQPLTAAAVKMFFESLSPLKQQLESQDIAEIMINDYRNVWIEHRTSRRSPAPTRGLSTPAIKACVWRQ
jgi:Flp pilus assembly CpaF family ATPase